MNAMKTHRASIEIENCPLARNLHTERNEVFTRLQLHREINILEKLVCVLLQYVSDVVFLIEKMKLILNQINRFQ